MILTPKIYVSDWAMDEDEYVCKKCKDLIQEPRRLTRREFESGVDYECTKCGALIYKSKNPIA